MRVARIGSESIHATTVPREGGKGRGGAGAGDNKAGALLLAGPLGIGERTVRTLSKKQVGYQRKMNSTQGGENTRSIERSRRGLF